MYSTPHSMSPPPGHRHRSWPRVFTGSVPWRSSGASILSSNESFQVLHALNHHTKRLLHWAALHLESAGSRPSTVHQGPVGESLNLKRDPCWDKGLSDHSLLGWANAKLQEAAVNNLPGYVEQRSKENPMKSPEVLLFLILFSLSAVLLKELCEHPRGQAHPQVWHSRVPCIWIILTKDK